MSERLYLPPQELSCSSLLAGCSRLEELGDTIACTLEPDLHGRDINTPSPFSSNHPVPGRCERQPMGASRAFSRDTAFARGRCPPRRLLLHAVCWPLPVSFQGGRSCYRERRTHASHFLHPIWRLPAPESHGQASPIPAGMICMRISLTSFSSSGRR